MLRDAPRRRVLPWALILLGGGLGRTLPATPADPLDAMARAVAEAERGLAVGETQLAESRYRSALFTGWLLLGRLAEQTGDLERARLAFETAAASAVEVRAARVALARVLARRGEPDEAELVLRSLIAADTSDAEARRLLARTLAEAGRLAEAVQELEQLRYLTPDDSENAYLLATAYVRQGRLAEADALLAELAAAIPTPQTRILIGRTYRDADLHERARRAFAEALEMDPRVRRAHYYLGTVHLLERGTTALDDAVREFELELRNDPGDEMTSFYLGMALVEARRFAAAIPHLETASGRPEVRADALLFLSRGLLETGRVEEAIAAARRGLAATPGGGSPEAQDLGEFQARQVSSLHYQLAKALRQQGDGEAAGAHFTAAKRYQAVSSESARESLDHYLTSETTAGRLAPEAPPAPTDAAAVAGLVDSLESSLARVYLNLGVLEMRAARPRRAAELMARADALDPDLPDLQYSLGVALFNSAQFAAAAPRLQRAQAERGAGGQLTEMLALAWLNSDQPARAAELLARLPERAATPGLQYAYGLALARSGRPGDAEEIFLRLLQDDGEWPELNVVLGQAFAQQGDFAAAVESLRRALRLDPGVAEAHSTLAEIHLRRGELDAAEAELRAELARHGADTRAAYTLATVLDLNRKPDEAIAILRSLLAAEPHLAKGRYLLGKILLAKGATEEAREQLESAAGLAPEDANTRYQLGQAYQKLGRTDEARRQFDAFRELKRQSPAGDDS